MADDRLSVSALAELAGVSADTLRYYGRLGLVKEAGRTPAGHRYYGQAELERVRFVKSAQWFDLSLDQILELLDALDADHCRCGPTETLLRERIAAIDSQRNALDELRAVLCRLLAEDPPPAHGAAKACESCSADAAQEAQRQSEVEALRARLETVESSLTGFLGLGRRRRGRTASLARAAAGRPRT